MIVCDKQNSTRVFHKLMRHKLKRRVHGLAHAHESKCCFLACARCSEKANNTVNTRIKEQVD